MRTMYYKMKISMKDCITQKFTALISIERDSTHGASGSDVLI